jgi:hypothetical protein
MAPLALTADPGARRMGDSATGAIVWEKMTVLSGAFGESLPRLSFSSLDQGAGYANHFFVMALHDWASYGGGVI